MSERRIAMCIERGEGGLMSCLLVTKLGEKISEKAAKAKVPNPKPGQKNGNWVDRRLGLEVSNICFNFM